MLWLMFLINLGGTVYGYMWYWGQLVDTFQAKPLWYLPFVPDSPTASLFFTLSVGWLLLDSRHRGTEMQPQRIPALRAFIEAFALITSFKYGIWAVAMIAAGAYQGSPLVWQDWMLIGSHLGMAVEVMIYGRFYRYGLGAVALVSGWVLWNDYMDYHRGIFPYLPSVLLNDLFWIEKFTIALSLLSIGVAIFYYIWRKRRKV